MSWAHGQPWTTRFTLGHIASRDARSLFFPPRNTISPTRLRPDEAPYETFTSPGRRTRCLPAVLQRRCLELGTRRRIHMPCQEPCNTTTNNNSNRKVNSTTAPWLVYIPFTHLCLLLLPPKEHVTQPSPLPPSIVYASTSRNHGTTAQPLHSTFQQQTKPYSLEHRLVVNASKRQVTASP